MKQATAPMSLSVTFATTFILLLTAAALIGGVFWPALWFAAGVLTLVCVLCYLFAPVSYCLKDSRLIVSSHVRQKEFGPVMRCSRIEPPQRLPMLIGLRLLGNGGLFAGTGIFWTRMLGVFRAYVTSARSADLVLVETADRKIVISPQNPQLFVQSWENEKRASKSIG